LALPDLLQAALPSDVGLRRRGMKQLPRRHWADFAE
jgi:hypothetical protein